MNPGMVGVFIPIVAVGGFFLWMISLSPLGRALAERLKHGPIRGEPARSRLSWSKAWIACRQEVAELAERVDFTERLLAKSTSAERDVAR